MVTMLLLFLSQLLTFVIPLVFRIRCVTFSIMGYDRLRRCCHHGDGICLAGLNKTYYCIFVILRNITYFFI